MSDKVRILIVLGRIGRYWDNKLVPLEERVKIAEKVLGKSQPPTAYDAIVLTGGLEIAPHVSNAEIMSVRLQQELRSITAQQEICIHSAEENNQEALLHAVDYARRRWPQYDISFHIIISWYMIPRMRSYLVRHVNALTKLHGDIRSPRQIYWRFLENDDEIFIPSPLLLLREIVKKWLDLRRPDPVLLISAR